jgi:hypothetical protein
LGKSLRSPGVDDHTFSHSLTPARLHGQI